jgi:hypothetical protein
MGESTDTATLRDTGPAEPEGPGDERAQALAEETLRRREAALELRTEGADLRGV